MFFFISKQKLYKVNIDFIKLYVYIKNKKWEVCDEHT